MKARARRTDNGNLIIGYYCKHEFVKPVGSLTEEELKTATPIPPLISGGSSGGSSAEPPKPTEYVVVRDAIQTIEKKETTITSGGREVSITTDCAVFTEVKQGTIERETGFIDRNGKAIYEGDRIRYQSGMTSFEEYTVVFADGKFTTSPKWEWGCNWSPFSKSKVTVI